MKTPRTLATLALFGLAGTALPAAANQVTWYVTGHMQAAMPGTPADLLALAPAGAVFTAYFSFDTASASSPVAFTSDQWRYITSNALGGAGMDVAGNHIQSTAGVSTIIESASANGEQLTLNAGAVSGAAIPSQYQVVALDVLTLGTFGPSSADAAVKWPWFSPFGGAQGAFQMVPGNVLPDLSKASNPATLDLFAYDSVSGNYVHRLGTVEAISFTPFATPVPEPASWALLAAGGLFVVGAARARRKAA